MKYQHQTKGTLAEIFNSVLTVPQASKAESRTTKSLLMQDWVFKTGILAFLYLPDTIALSSSKIPWDPNIASCFLESIEDLNFRLDI